MNRGRHGGTILLLVIAAVTAFAVLAIAEDSEASWSGEPLPPWGGDWTITMDTVYTNEVIRLDGDINIDGPNTLSLDGCTLIFNCSYPGEHGIGGYYSSILYINDSASRQGVVKSNASSEDWYFWTDGAAYFNAVEIMDLDYGIYSYSTYLYVEGCTISSTYNGIYSYADAHIGNTTLNVLRPDGSVSSMYTYGIYAGYGTYSLHNIEINIVVDINEMVDTSSYYYRYYTYGIYMYYANVGKLEAEDGGTFSIDIDVDAYWVNNRTYSSYQRFYHYFYSRPIYMSGNTICKSIKGIDISVDEEVTSHAPNADRGAYVNIYNYQYLIYNGISSSGEIPVEYADMTFSMNTARSTVLGTVYRDYMYLYSTMLYMTFSSGAVPDDSVQTFHDLNFVDSFVEYVFRAPRYGEWNMTDCTFSNIVAEYILYLYYCDSDFTIADNTFTNLETESSGDYLFYIYRNSGVATLVDNTFEYLEGYRIFYMYYTSAQIVFQSNLVSENEPWRDYSLPWCYIYNSDGEVLFDSNTFRDNILHEGLIYCYNTRNAVRFENNLVESNRFTDYMIYLESVNDNVNIYKNEIVRNHGPIFEFYYTWGRVTVESNIIEENDLGEDYLLYTYYTYRNMDFIYNQITDNVAEDAVILLRGPTYFSSGVTFIFDQNVFTSNTVGSDLDDGIVLVRGARYNMALRRNEFIQNTGTCINFYRPYTYNSWYRAYTFTVDNCIFTDNDGACTSWIDFRSYNIVVKRNEGSGNSGPLVYHTLTERNVYDTYYPYTIGEMSGPVSIEVSNNNYTSNLAGAIDIERAQWRDSSTPYTNTEQTIRLSNNILRDNGDAWAISVRDFGEFPLMVANAFEGCPYGVYLSAIYPGIWPKVTMYFEGSTFDGGANGQTAWGLVNVHAEFTDCTFLNYERALYARDCIINVYWSSIGEGSGWTEGIGYIYVWNNLEVLITWEDVNGIDSGVPAVGATLAMLGTNGRYYGQMVTSINGTVGPMVIQPWSSLEGRMDQWAPYVGTIEYGGSTAEHDVHIVGDYVGDDALHLTIRDNDMPAIVVTQPAVDSISNLVDMPAEGFLFEVGSGIGSFLGYIDGGDAVEITPNEAWTAMFKDLSQGDHTMVVEAIDMATNKETISIDFTIDAVAPTLDIVTPPGDVISRDPNLVIQGSYEDDVSEVFEITVRINGIPIDSSNGVITEPYKLTEGVNTIIVDATDAAGNVRTVRRLVTLDSYPPTLYVYTPLHLLVTNEPILEVDGLSEADTMVLIEQVRASDGVLIASDVAPARGDGVFRATLDLEEGEQHIVFTAEDDAGNVRSLTRTVTLDTTPPGLTIESPREGDFINQPSADLVAQVTDDNPESVKVIVNGVPIVHTGLITLDLPLIEGINSIEVIAIDQVDNQVVKTVNVTRDTIAPLLVVETPDSMLTNQRELMVRGYVNDDGHIVRVAGATVNVDEDNRFLAELDISTEQSPIEVIAEDRAGNTVTSTITFIFDDVKPTITLTDPPGAETSEVSLKLDGTVTDNEATIEFVTVRGKVFPVRDGKFSALLTVDTSGEGWNNFTISATDDAGNIGVYKVNVQYKAPKDGGPDEEEEEESMWWYVGLLLIIAALVIMATVYVFANRGEEE